MTSRILKAGVHDNNLSLNSTFTSALMDCLDLVSDYEGVVDKQKALKQFMTNNKKILAGFDLLNLMKQDDSVKVDLSQLKTCLASCEVPDAAHAFFDPFICKMIRDMVYEVRLAKQCIQVFENMHTLTNMHAQTNKDPNDHSPTSTNNHRNYNYNYNCN